MKLAPAIALSFVCCSANAQLIEYVFGGTVPEVTPGSDLNPERFEFTITVDASTFLPLGPFGGTSIYRSSNFDASLSLDGVDIPFRDISEFASPLLIITTQENIATAPSGTSFDQVSISLTAAGSFPLFETVSFGITAITSEAGIVDVQTGLETGVLPSTFDAFDPSQYDSFTGNFNVVNSNAVPAFSVTAPESTALIDFVSVRTIPAPGVAATLGLGGLFAVRRRRLA